MVEYKVIRPHLVRSRRRLRAWPCCCHALAWPLARQLQAGRAPEPVGRADAHAMPVAAGKDTDAAIAIARILRRQLLRSARSRPRPSPSCGPGSATPIAPPRTACRPVARETHAPGHTQLDADEPARSPIFCRDFLHHLDLEVTLGHQLLQPRILCLELLQPPHVVRLQSAEPLAPDVGRSSVR